MEDRRSTGAGQEPVGGGGLRRGLLGSARAQHQGRLPAAAILDSGQPERARRGRPGGADGERHEPVYDCELRAAQGDRSRLVSAHGGQWLLHGDDRAAQSLAAAALPHQQPDLQQPAARCGRGPFAAVPREPALYRRVHRERGDVVQQQPSQPHGRGIRPRADVVVGRQQQPAIPDLGRGRLRAAVRDGQASAERGRVPGGRRRRLADRRHLRIPAGVRSSTSTPTCSTTAGMSTTSRRATRRLR